MRFPSRDIIQRFMARATVFAVLAGSLLIPLAPVSASAASLAICSGDTDSYAFNAQNNVIVPNNACTKFVNKYINPVITLMTILVGVGAAVSFILAAIQYSGAGDDPGATSKAKNRIFQTVIGIIGYFLLFGFVNYIVPGGLFN